MRRIHSGRVLAGIAAPIAVAALAVAPAASARSSAPVPVIRSISVASGSITGGTKITVTGSGLAHASKVRFGSVATTHLSVLSSSKVMVTTPRHASGKVNVRIQTHSRGVTRTSAATSRARFTFVSLPHVSRVAPATSPPAGGRTVTVRGYGFVHVTAVHFGAAPATDVKTVSRTELTVVAPRHAVGLVVVRVTTLYGGSEATAAASFRYLGREPPGPTPVTRLAIYSTGGWVTLRWANPAGVTGIVVRRAKGTTAPSSVTAGVAVPVTGAPTRVVDHSVPDSDPYSYSVFAAHGSEYSSPASAISSVPGPVTALTLSVAPGTMAFRWVNPPDFDHVIVSLGAGIMLPPPGASPTGIDVGRAERYTATGLKSRTQYCLTIFTLDAAGNYRGDESTCASTPDGDDVAPGPVRALTAAPSPRSVRLSWTIPDDADVVGVAVARADGSAVPASPTTGWVVGQSEQDATTITDPDVAPDHAYTYAVWAVDGSGNYSTPVTVTATTPPGNPTAAVTHLRATALPPSIVASGQSIRLQWGVPAGAVSLLVARAVGAKAPDKPEQSQWTLSAPTASFLDSGRPDATEYSYSVWAVAADGTYSPVASVSATSDPGLPRHLSGRVLNSVTLDPVAVSLVLTDGDRSYSTTSHADGSYAVDVQVGTYSICAQAASATGGGADHGYLRTCGSVVVTDDASTGYDLHVLPAVTLLGTVTDSVDHQPLAGVQLVERLSGTTYLLATTGADGRFEFDGLSATSTPMPIDVRSDGVTNGVPTGYLDTTFTYTAPTAGLTVVHDVALAPRPVVTVHGRLTSAADGSPIAGVNVDLIRPDRGPRPTVATADDGTFTASIGVPAHESVYACFDAEGLGRGAAPSTGFTNACFGGTDFDPLSFAPIPPAGATPLTDGQDVSMALQPLSTITGTVRSTDGGPLSGATITETPAGRTDPYATVTTDANGRYTLHTPIRPGGRSSDTLRVCVHGARATGGTSSAGYLWQCSATVSPTAAQPAVTADVALAPAARVVGTVTDGPTATTLAGVRVTLSEASAGHNGDSSVVTAADGSYAFDGIDLANGNTTFKVCVAPAASVTGPDEAQYADQCAGGDTPTIVAPSAGAVSRVDMPLVRAGAVSGVLRGADTDQPLAGVTITLFGGDTSTVTDARGRFSFARVRPGTGYNVSTGRVAQGQFGYLGARLEQAPAVDDPEHGWNFRVFPGATTTADLTLPVAAAVTVAAVTQAGVPIVGAHLTSSLSAAPVVDTGADGAGTLTALDPSGYDVRTTVCASGGTAPGSTTSYWIECAHMPARVLGQRSQVTIVLGPSNGNVPTTVYDEATGQPIPGAWVTYWRVSDNGVSSDSEVTGGSGVAGPVVATPLGSAPQRSLHYRVCASAAGYRQSCALDDVADGTSGTAFDTQPGITTSVQIGLTPQ